MTYEQFKSWLLTGLVLLSIVLFWNLVTFQQNYDSIPNQEYISNISIEKTKEMPDIVVPNKIIYREGENEYWGSESKEAILPIIDEIEKWEFYDVQITGNEFRDLFSQTNNNDVLIIQYPDSVPMELTKSLFKLDSEQLNGHFDYVIIFPNELQGDEGFVYFTTNDFKSIKKARIRYRYLGDFKGITNTFLDQSYRFYAYKKDLTSYLYVLDDSISLNNYHYLQSNYAISQFKNALFTDPSIVSVNRNQYTDTSSLLEYYETGMLSYVNTTVAKIPVPLNQLIQMGVGFINEHGGFTDQYYFSTTEEENSKISFQLHLNDYPVFDQNGLSRITVVVGNQGIYSYERPYFKLDEPLEISYYQNELPPGSEVLAYLESLEDFSLKELEDLSIGYNLTKKYNEPLIKLEPSWFYKIHGKWVRITIDEMGGTKGGLE